MGRADADADADPVLVYVYGPPAVGKLTIARHVQEISGLSLFHNHLTVNALRSVFEFGSPAFTEVIQRVRIDVFATAVRNGIGVIFTNNSMWGPPDGDVRFLAFADGADNEVRWAGGRTMFVRLTAPKDVLVSRVDDPVRRSGEKLTDPTRLAELLAATPEPVVPRTSLTIDTSVLSAKEAARAISEAISRHGTE